MHKLQELWTKKNCYDFDIRYYEVFDKSDLEYNTLKSATIIQCTIKGRFEESLVATFSKKATAQKQSGVSQDCLNTIGSKLPGITWGWGQDMPWTKEEQKKAWSDYINSLCNGND